jgi:lactoylglutathione lyase
MVMKYLHTMVRVSDIDESLDFFCNKLGLAEVRRYDNEQGKFTLIFVAAPGDESNCIELTYNWDPEEYGEGRNFGHIAFGVDDIYAVCRRLMDRGVVINRPPRDGKMAFVRSPDNISIELLQHGPALAPAEPWASMPNVGHW